MGKILCVSSIAIGLAVTKPATASPIGFSWRTTPSCPDREWALARVEAHLGQAMPDTNSGVVSVDARFSPTESGKFAVELVIASAAGERTRSFQHSNCERLAEAAALVIAIAILPASRAEPETELDGVTDVASPPTALPSLKVDASPASNSASRYVTRSTRNDWLGVGAAPHVGAGQLPHVVPGAWLWLELSATDWLYGVVGLRYFPSSHLSVSARPNASVAVSLVSGIIRSCAGSAGSTRLSLCVGAELGSMVASGHGLDTNRTSTDRYIAANLGLILNRRLSRRFSLVLGVEGARTIQRPQLRIDGFGDVFHPNDWSCFGFAGLVIRPFA